MSERVFVKDDGYAVHTLRFPTGVTFARSTYVSEGGTNGYGCGWSLNEIEGGNRGGGYVEVFPQPAELPPTTADLSTELAAYKQFAATITASFADTVKRNHQLDYQAAFDELRDKGFEVSSEAAK